MFNTHPKIIALDRICPGRRHAWYDTNLGFKVRKPIGQAIDTLAKIMSKPEVKDYAKDVASQPMKDKQSNYRKYFIYGLEVVAVAIIIYMVFFY